MTTMTWAAKAPATAQIKVTIPTFSGLKKIAYFCATAMGNKAANSSGSCVINFHRKQGT